MKENLMQRKRRYLLTPKKELAERCLLIEQEIERLNNIIKEVREYIEENKEGTDCCGETYIGLGEEEINGILEILDGSDKE